MTYSSSRRWEVFKACEQFSNLKLNLKKTAVILADPNLKEAKARVQGLAEETALMKVEKNAKYLGIWIGPDGAAQSWKEVADKYAERAARWCQLRCGLALDVPRVPHGLLPPV